jgi:hypothetical protein
MSKAIALSPQAFGRAYEAARQRQADLLGSAIVLGCGMALILAGKALPF